MQYFKELFSYCSTIQVINIQSLVITLHSLSIKQRKQLEKEKLNMQDELSTFILLSKLTTF